MTLQTWPHDHVLISYSVLQSSSSEFFLHSICTIQPNKKHFVHFGHRASNYDMNVKHLPSVRTARCKEIYGFISFRISISNSLLFFFSCVYQMRPALLLSFLNLIKTLQNVNAPAYNIDTFGDCVTFAAFHLIKGLKSKNKKNARKLIGLLC